MPTLESRALAGFWQELEKEREVLRMWEQGEKEEEVWEFLLGGEKEFLGRGRKREKRGKWNFVDWGLIKWGKDGKIVLL